MTPEQRAENVDLDHAVLTAEEQRQVRAEIVAEIREAVEEFRQACLRECAVPVQFGSVVCDWPPGVEETEILTRQRDAREVAEAIRKL